MGQKVHPYGFRLGVIKTWNSKWFEDKAYAKWLHEDIRIKRAVKEYLMNANIASVEVERAANKAKVIVFTARPGMVIGKGGKGPPYSTVPLAAPLPAPLDPKLIEPALAAPLAAPLLEPALAIESGAVDSLPPQAVVATAAPTAPAAKRAARDKRPASTRVGPLSKLAVAPQNGQTASPRLT